MSPYNVFSAINTLWDRISDGNNIISKNSLRSSGMLTKLEHECLSEVMTSYHELNQKKSMPKDVFVNSLFKAHSSDAKFQTMLKDIIT